MAASTLDMAEDKYAQVVVEQCFDLLERFLVPKRQEELFVSNRALCMILKNVDDHLAKAFDSGEERALFRGLRGKLNAVSEEMFKDSRTVGDIRVFTIEAAEKLLKNWCKAPQFD